MVIDSWLSNECVDADVRAGEFGGIGVTESVHQRARYRLSIGASTFECSFDTRLQCSLGNALTVTADDNRERAG